MAANTNRVITQQPLCPQFKVCKSRSEVNVIYLSVFLNVQTRVSEPQRCQSKQYFLPLLTGGRRVRAEPKGGQGETPRKLRKRQGQSWPSQSQDQLVWQHHSQCRKISRETRSQRDSALLRKNLPLACAV